MVKTIPPGAELAPITIPDELIDTLRVARSVVFFTGAGASSESGIPTFRDALTGLWDRFDAEALATPEAFVNDPALVWGWYEWRRRQVEHAQPHPGHQAMAALEECLPAVTVITQNVDDLHERAGSRRVIHLHGSLFAPRCFDCGQPYHLPPEPLDAPGDGRRLPPPRCAACDGLVRPGVVWFNEPLPEQVWHGALAACLASDLFFVIGTSGLVWPAADLPCQAHKAGARVVQVNPVLTRYPKVPTLDLQGQAGRVLPALLERFREAEAG